MLQYDGYNKSKLREFPVQFLKRKECQDGLKESKMFNRKQPDLLKGKHQVCHISKYRAFTITHQPYDEEAENTCRVNEHVLASISTAQRSSIFFISIL